MDKASLSIALGSAARRIGHASMAKPAVAAMAGIAAIAWTLASLMPPFWALGELVLLAACILLIREGTVVYAKVPSGRNPDDSLANLKAWSGGTTAWFEGSAAKQFGTPRHDTRATATDSDEMLTRAFNRASLRHRSDDAGNPENIRHLPEYVGRR